MIQLKPFQTEDLANAALRDGVILAWEQGLGKTIAAILWPQLRKATRTLIVAPASLHQQLQQSVAKHFGIWLQTISTIEEARRHNFHKPLPKPGSKPKYYLTSWEAYTRNNAVETPQVDEETRLADDDWRLNVGETHGGIFCCAVPSLATAIGNWCAVGAGVNAVVLDEGTRLQGDDSLFSLATRRCIPANRLVLTGTPIKNRLDSIFWLCWWAAGGSNKPTSLWPYPGDNDGRQRFANQHLEHDQFVTREAEMDPRDRRQIKRRSNRACNVEHLYKLLAPLILRRRKLDTGTSMQLCTYHPIDVPPGTHQLTAYHKILHEKHFYTKTGKLLTDARSITGRRVELLREACLAPWSDRLPHRSAHIYTPKLQALLQVVEQCLSRGEQVLIGSPSIPFTETLVNTLKAAGIRVARCDGTETPSSRGAIAHAFKQHNYSVMVAGLKAMAEGHDFAQCPNLILPALSWAMDEVEQFIHRIWRLSSPGPVRVYLISCLHTIDAKLRQVHGEKRDSAGLALDGDLAPDNVEPMSLAQLLNETHAIAANLPDGELSQDEAHIRTQLQPLLRHGLRTAQTRYNEWHPPIAAYHTSPNQTLLTRDDLRNAVAAIDEPPLNDPATFLRRLGGQS
jgi:SNF2 family DNA or RNA helicase